MYTFKSFIRGQNCILNEMALKRSQVRSEMFHQFESIFEHLVKVFIGQDLNSAKENNDWHKQISNFFNRISSLKLKETNRAPELKFIESVFKEVLEDYRETSRFKSTLQEISYFHKYDNTPLYIPKNEDDFWNLIETEFRDLLVGLSKGENLFREKYTDILNKIKNIEKRTSFKDKRNL